MTWKYRANVLHVVCSERTGTICCILDIAGNTRSVQCPANDVMIGANVKLDRTGILTSQAYRQSIARAVKKYGMSADNVATMYGVTERYVYMCIDEWYEDMTNIKYAKEKGTRFETAVAYYLAERTGKKIERRTRCGRNDCGDIANVTTFDGRPVVIECKNEKKATISLYLNEAEIERINANAVAGIVVFKREKIGTRKESPTGRQCVAMTLECLESISSQRLNACDDMIYSNDGIVIYCGTRNYHGKYDIESIMQEVETHGNDCCDAYVVKHETKDGRTVVFTTLHELVNILNGGKIKKLTKNI